MNDTIKKDIISILKSAIPLLEKDDFAGLIEISNHTTHNASIYQDKYSIQIAVIIYSLSKILERAKIEEMNISTDVAKILQSALDYIESDNFEKYDFEIKRVLKFVSEKDEKLPLYVKSVVEKANIAKASRIYSQGISLARTAEMLGVNQWDLMSFVGKTKISDQEYFPFDVSKRIEFTRKLFRIQ